MAIERYELRRIHERTLEGTAWITLTQLAREAHCAPEVIGQLVATGVVDPPATDEREPCFPAAVVERVSRGLRLQRDLGLNLNALALVLDLLDRIDRLENELERLRGH